MTCFKPMDGDGKWLTIPFAPWWPTWMLHPQRSYSSFDVQVYVQIKRQEPLWNETMLLSQKWTDMLDGLQWVPWTIMQQHGHDHALRRWWWWPSSWWGCWWKSGCLKRTSDDSPSNGMLFFWIRASYVIMLSYFQVAKKVLLHLCPAAGYLA